MRNLTIKRTKSFVGCLVKLKVYIEDPISGELNINGIACRKIGEIKNGQEGTFQVGEESAKVFVIADKLSKNYCNEFYQLPEGQEDISLSGKCKFNPAAGNAFRFDNNDTEATIENRKRGNRKGAIALIAAAIIGVIVGIIIGLGGEAEPKTFSVSGMSITLTDEFSKEAVQGFTAVYYDDEITVICLKESFDLMAGLENYSITQYGNLIIENNNLSSSRLETADGLKTFSYDAVNAQENCTYTYICYIYKSDDAFWFIQFATKVEKADQLKEEIHNYAKTVTFAN